MFSCNLNWHSILFSSPKICWLRSVMWHCTHRPSVGYTLCKCMLWVWYHLQIIMSSSSVLKHLLSCPGSASKWCGDDDELVIMSRDFFLQIITKSYKIIFVWTFYFLAWGSFLGQAVFVEACSHDMKYWYFRMICYRVDCDALYAYMCASLDYMVTYLVKYYFGHIFQSKEAGQGS